MFDKLLSKSYLHKTLRVLSWISRFLRNARKHRLKRLLATNKQHVGIEMFKINQTQPRVKVCEKRLYQCFSRIQSESSYFYHQGDSSSKLVQEAHILTIRGKVKGVDIITYMQNFTSLTLTKSFYTGVYCGFKRISF